MSFEQVLIIGAKLRAARQQQKLSLRELATRADVSPSLLSQIENGKTNPSVLTLHSVATALDVPITYFFPKPTENGRLPALLLGSELASNTAYRDRAEPDRSPLLLHPKSRVAIELMGGVRWERLTPADEQGIQFLEIQYQPGASSGQAMSRHVGREFGLVLEGELKLEIGNESLTLYAGDSIIFDSNTPHRLLNERLETVRAIWIDMNLSG